MKFEKEIEIYVSIWFRLCRSRCLCFQMPIQIWLWLLAPCSDEMYQFDNFIGYFIFFYKFSLSTFFYVFEMVFFYFNRRFMCKSENFSNRWKIRGYTSNANLKTDSNWVYELWQELETVLKKPHSDPIINGIHTHAPIHINVLRSPNQVCFWASAISINIHTT